MKLMKRWLCLKNNCQTGKFEETTLFAAGKKIYIIYIIRGPLLKKAHEERRKR